jgi:hypothetical protein
VFSLPRKSRRRTSTREVLLRCLPQSQRGRRFRPPAARYSELGHDSREKDAKDSELQLLARYGQNVCVMAVGRKNWLFAGSLRAGQRAAVIMSLIQSAKMCGHEPYRYLRDVLERLPTHPASRLEELLPHRWQPTSDKAARLN